MIPGYLPDVNVNKQARISRLNVDIFIFDVSIPIKRYRNEGEDVNIEDNVLNVLKDVTLDQFRVGTLHEFVHLIEHARDFILGVGNLVEEELLEVAKCTHR